MLMLQLYGLLFLMLSLKSASAQTECRIASCRDIYLTEDNPTSGEYIIETSNGEPVYVFCDFYQNRGYTFVSKDDLGKLTDLSELYTENNHMLVRILYANDEQHDVVIQQLGQYKFQYPLTFQLSDFDGFTPPFNAPLKPYIHVGFLPTNFAGIKSSTKPARQGYRTAGMDIIFDNCDQTPNSYFAIFQNPSSMAESLYWQTCGCDFPIMKAWIDKAQLTPMDREMPDKYFYLFEMHLGGCGGYVSSGNLAGVIDGIAFGFAFEIPGSQVTCTPKYCASINSQYKSCEVLGACIITSLTMIRQFSDDSTCILDTTYGKEGDNKIWVDDGCRAKFWVCFL